MRISSLDPDTITKLVSQSNINMSNKIKSNVTSRISSKKFSIKKRKHQKSIHKINNSNLRISFLEFEQKSEEDDLTGHMKLMKESLAFKVDMVKDHDNILDFSPTRKRD